MEEFYNLVLKICHTLMRHQLTLSKLVKYQRKLRHAELAESGHKLPALLRPFEYNMKLITVGQCYSLLRPNL